MRKILSAAVYILSFAGAARAAETSLYTQRGAK